MFFRRAMFAITAFLFASAVSAEPFAKLREAYAARDHVAAAAAYAPDAVVIYRYDGSAEQRYAGRAAIEKSFRALFDQIDPKDPLDLNFRVTKREGAEVEGIYRLRIGEAAAASYGRFAVTLHADGSFARDASMSATLADFEEAAGGVLLAADSEDLERNYYAALTGRYRLPDDCDLVVTRSVVRLFVRNSCTEEWRGLTRQAGRVWTAGDRVISKRQIATYRFEALRDGSSPAVIVETPDAVQKAARETPYRTEDVLFTSADGTSLAGTVYVPLNTRNRHPATVMLHGSGPQDRDGYASIIAVLADEMAANGRVVLAFDKRGTGGSHGDGNRATFDVLAADAIAAMNYLAQKKEVDAARIGLAGSSQAGWVAAKAIHEGARPSDVLLLGAAGAALTVAEQNLYNTRVRAGCAGLSQSDVRLALEQQRAFFAFLKDPKKGAALDTITVRARSRLALADWLFPDSRTIDRTAGEWYNVLDPAFDPLPIWNAFEGKAVFLFSEHDDATPTRVAIDRLKGSSVKAKLVKGAQHLGLVSTNICQSYLTNLRKFAPDLFQTIGDFAQN